MCLCFMSVHFLCALAVDCRKLSSVIILVLCLIISTVSFPVRIKKDILDANVDNYLMKFGYLPNAADGAFSLRTEESVRDGLRDLQEFAGIPATGRLDEPTIKLLKRPRCGLPDKVQQTSGRRKRFTLQGDKWPYTNLTWCLQNRSLSGLDVYEVRLMISEAFNVWSRHSRLKFTEVNSDRADILIYFYRLDHGDHFNFDGKGIVLAHAFFPNGGKSIDVHFDADEDWTLSSDPNDEGTNLFNVAAHEFGHSLGLAHSSVETALMFPWYKEIEQNGFDFELPDDDKTAIQTLYGAREDRLWGRINPYRPPPARPPNTTTTTTTTTQRTRRTYRTFPTHATRPPQKPYDPRFPNGYNPYNPYNPYPYPPYNPNRKPDKQPYYPKYPMHPDKKPHYHPKQDNKPDRRYPPKPPEKIPERTTPVFRPIERPTRPPVTPIRGNSDNDKEYPATKPPPDTCDTNYDAISVIRREVFIFKDNYFWRINDEGVMPGYPAEIKRFWRGLPRDMTHVDAVYERPDDRIVFFVGKLYYVFSGTSVIAGYPRPITDLGLPSSLQKIDGATVWGHNGKTYFYSGSMYWKFDEETGKVDLDYARDISTWKGVGSDIDAVFQWKDGKTYFFKGKGFWKFNDMLMRVDQVEQKLSAPFWMGCTNNLKGKHEVGEKLPRQAYIANGHVVFPNLLLIILSFSIIKLYKVH